MSYALGITDIDPLRYELLFERFLNPDRISMPDIDIDFCMRRRGEVIQYVSEKYGRDRVAQIITFGTLGAKAVLRDVGRVLGVPYGKIDRIAKLVPDMTKSLSEAAREIEALKQEAARDVEVAQDRRGRQPARGADAPRLAPRRRRRHRAARRSRSWSRSTRRPRTRSSPSGTRTWSRASGSSRWTSWACARSPSSTTR